MGDLEFASAVHDMQIMKIDRDNFCYMMRLAGEVTATAEAR